MITPQQIFKDIDIKDKVVLDVGSGNGNLLRYAVSRGAKSGVGLEPTLQCVIGQESLCFMPTRIQHYDMPKEYFDIIVLQDSINHLDELACIWLFKTQDARNKYRGIFNTLYKGLKHGGKVIITDSSPNNFWANLGMRTPFCSSIEWHKHHTPQTWIQLLRQSCIYHPKINWLVPNQLKFLGWLVKYKLVSYFIMSHFRIVMEKV